VYCNWRKWPSPCSRWTLFDPEDPLMLVALAFRTTNGMFSIPPASTELGVRVDDQHGGSDDLLMLDRLVSTTFGLAIRPRIPGGGSW